MAQALLLERPQRGVTHITARGRDVLAKVVISRFLNVGWLDD
jgi:hypothetical protein